MKNVLVLIGLFSLFLTSFISNSIAQGPPPAYTTINCGSSYIIIYNDGNGNDYGFDVVLQGELSCLIPDPAERPDVRVRLQFYWPGPPLAFNSRSQTIDNWIWTPAYGANIGWNQGEHYYNMPPIMGSEIDPITNQQTYWSSDVYLRITTYVANEFGDWSLEDTKEFLLKKQPVLPSL